MTLEVGPKHKKVVAAAPDWPGLERGASSGEAAIGMLESYLPRYAKVARLAGMGAEFATISKVDLVEQYPGTGSPDFWGISFAFSSIDGQEMSSQELERQLTLMQACWTFFDDVRGRVARPSGRCIQWRGPGHCGTSSGTPPITRWTTPGKWKTRTWRARSGRRPTAAHCRR